MSTDYSEDMLVEQPTIELFSELEYETAIGTASMRKSAPVARRWDGKQPQKSSWSRSCEVRCRN